MDYFRLTDNPGVGASITTRAFTYVVKTSHTSGSAFANQARRLSSRLLMLLMLKVATFSGSLSVLSAASYPPLHKRKNGAPTMLVMSARSKARPPRLTLDGYDLRRLRAF